MKAKKFLALILSLTMLLGLCTVGASAAEYAEGTVAVIGETEYSSVETAIKAARDGDVVQIVQAGTYSFDYNNMILYYSITIEGIEGQPNDVVLKNGSNAWKGITVNGRTEGSHPEVTIKNLVLDGNISEKPSILTPIVCQYGDLTLENVTLKNAVRAVEVSAAETLSPSGGYVDGLTSTVTLKNVKTEGISGNTVKVEALPATDRSTEVTTTAVVCYDEVCGFVGGMTALVRSGVNGVEGKKNHIVNKVDAEGNVLESTDLLPGNVTENDFISPAAYQDDVNGDGTRTYYPAKVLAGNNGFLTLQEAISAAGEGDTIKILENAEIGSDTTLNHTIDFSGNTITVKGGTLTITGGSYNGEIVKDGGTLSVSGGTFAVAPDKADLVTGKAFEAAEGVGVTVVDAPTAEEAQISLDTTEKSVTTKDTLDDGKVITATFDEAALDAIRSSADDVGVTGAVEFVAETATASTPAAPTGESDELVFDMYFKDAASTTRVPYTGGETEVSFPLTGVAGRFYKVYFVDGSNLIDMNARYVNGMLRFRTSHFSTYKVTSIAGDPATQFALTLVPTSNPAQYKIVLDHTDEEYINRFTAAELVFKLTQGTGGHIDYMISGNPSSYIKINDAKSSGDLYAFYVNGKDTYGNDISDVSGTSIQLGTVTFVGYCQNATFTIEKTGTKVNTTTLTDNIVVTTADGGNLTINNTANTSESAPTAKIYPITLNPVTKDLTINVTFPNTITNQAYAYQDMTVTVSGGDLTNDVVVKLGTTPDITSVTPNVYPYAATAATTAAFENGSAYVTGSNDLSGVMRYTVTLTDILTENEQYRVTVAGAGYRTTYYNVLMNLNKTLTFWNNVMDTPMVVETGKTAPTVQVTYLAGDIVQDAQINIYDLSAVVSYFGTENETSAVSQYAKYDLNRDGKIDSIDVAYVLVSWGK